ncbi:acyltransferase [Methylobacterium sp. J-026]|uniref:acyltransferase family protein n=1 Tax=Methylobacterium sp. J-026 TaxID=2836624 RepID=UPI001FB89A01|nr:acyltransferase [Methylobacterium sp. J-026]MCJ2134546.1 acyltransferase [Methylobacterium sp. J-026]
MRSITTVSKIEFLQKIKLRAQSRRMALQHERYVALDALRGISSIAVVLFHCGIYLHDPSVMGHGSLAVDVFFVMSGFVVDRAYGARLRSGWSSRAFAAARFKRLYPLYAAGTLLGASCFAVMLGPHADLASYLAIGALLLCAALLIPIPRDDTKAVFPLNGPSWSLMAEAVVNVLYAIILRRLSKATLFVVTCVAACALGGARAAGYPLLLGGQTATLWLDLIRAAFGFSVGLLLAAHVNEICSTAVLTVRLPALLLICAIIYAVPADAAPAWADLIAVLLVSPAIVAAAITSRRNYGEERWCSVLGRLSYPLYIVHMPVLYMASTYAPANAELPSVRVAMILGSSLVSLGIAACLSWWVEPHLLQATSEGRTPDDEVVAYRATLVCTSPTR